MLDQLRKKIAEMELPQVAQGEFPGQAAVLMALTDDPVKPEVILTRRAKHLNSHSGEVSFPGGMWEVEDQSLMDTALRESHEEVALLPSCVEVLGAMPSRRAKSGVKVTPIVGVVPHDVVLIPNQDELDCIFRVPLSYFLQDPRCRTDMFQRNDREFWAPAYLYEGYEIWGLTSGLLIEFLNCVLDANISVDSDAPVRVYS